MSEQREKVRAWMGRVPATDDFGDTITDEFIDGRLAGSSTWALMTPRSWRLVGSGKLGTGYGQRYVKRETDDVFEKVEG